MQQLFPFFYRNIGIKRIQNLISPRVFNFNDFPRNSFVHELSHTHDHDSYNIDPSKLYYVNFRKRILVDYVQNLDVIKSTPRKKIIQIRDSFREFHMKNKQFRYQLDNYRVIEDQNALMVLNYNFLDALYVYSPLPMAEYYKWWNLEYTRWNTIEKICKESTRNHFVFINIPSDIPGFALLNTYSKISNIAMMKIFDTNEKLFILELWKWISEENRSESTLNCLTTSSLSKVNIVFTSKDGRSSLLNLGYLNSWIKGAENLTEFPNVAQYEDKQIQRLFLKHLMVMATLAPEEIEQIPEESTSPVEQSSQDTSDVNLDNDIEDDAEEQTDFYSGVGSGITPNSAQPPESNIVAEFKETDAEVNADSIEDALKDIDEEIKTLDTVNKIQLKQKGVHVDETNNASGLSEPVEYIEDDIPIEAVRDSVYKPMTAEESLAKQVNEFAEYGLITASEFKKVSAEIGSYGVSKDPYGSDQNVSSKAIVTTEDIKIDRTDSDIVAGDMVLDKTMLSSTLQTFDSKYVNEVLQKDVLSMVHGLQKSGVIVRRHEIEVDHSALGSYEHHTVELKPLDGVASTLHFKLPKVNEDGTFTAAGNKYTFRKQRVDLPIRKIAPNEVALSSYYGKTFVSRGTKKANNTVDWVIRQINKAYLEDTGYIKDIAPANVYDNNYKAPYIYNALAENFKSFKAGRYVFIFDKTDEINLAGNQDVKDLKAKGYQICGYTLQSEPIVVDFNDEFHVYSKKTFIPIGNIFKILKLQQMDGPSDYSEIRVFKKTIPVAAILAYHIGFKNLVRLLNAKHRVIEGRRVNDIQDHEYAIVFNDFHYIFDRNEKLNTLILSGFHHFEKQVKTFKLEEFENKDVYLNLLSSKGISSIYIKEIEISDQLFVDPITKSILEEMKEPTTLRGLMIRASEMLLNYSHPDSQDMSQMRIRGYERFAGAIYKEMAMAIRQYKSRNIAGKSKIEISPYKVWATLMEDPAKKMVEDINPIQNLKESEIVTYVGEGGRGKDSVNKESRAYHIHDIGVISEATVDSSDVGINTYLSANPNFSNLRGVISKEKDTNPSNIVSTSALLAPGSDKDDAKRVNFVSIQMGHLIATEGYHQPYVRTGYESVIGNRTSEMFAYHAKKNGKVTKLTENGITIEYEDGTTKGIVLGRVFGRAEGSVYPHDIVSPLKEGKNFNKGDVIAYNTGFFEQDLLDSTKVVMKNSMVVKTALYESNQTFEDSSSISKAVSAKLTAKTTKVKSLTVDFTQNLLEVVKVGQSVSPKDILLIIEDEITSSAQFDEKSLAILRKLSNQAPKAKYEGTIDKIEVFYNGDKQDMTNSLKKIADASDRVMAEECKATGRPVVNGSVTEDYRVAGVPLSLDKAEIKIYITIKTQSGVGDKGVFANQMKSVFGEVMDYDMVTESGEKIDAVFGYNSILNRVVNSPFIIGTTTTLLKKIAEKAVAIYKG